MNFHSRTEICPAERKNLTRKKTEVCPCLCSLVTHHCPLFQSKKDPSVICSLAQCWQTLFKGILYFPSLLSSLKMVYYSSENYTLPPSSIHLWKGEYKSVSARVMSRSLTCDAVSMHITHFQFCLINQSLSVHSNESAKGRWEIPYALFPCIH